MTIERSCCRTNRWRPVRSIATSFYGVKFHPHLSSISSFRMVFPKPGKNLGKTCFSRHSDQSWLIKAVLKYKLTTFWHIFVGTFYRKRIQFVGTLIFTIENRLMFLFFNKCSVFLKKKRWQIRYFEKILLFFPRLIPFFLTYFWSYTLRKKCKITV